MPTAGSGGPPGGEEGVPLPGPGCLLRSPAWSPGSQPGSGCCLEVLGSGADSPFLAMAESPGRTRGAWRLQHSYRFTWALELGLIRLQDWKCKDVSRGWTLSPGQPPLSCGPSLSADPSPAPLTTPPHTPLFSVSIPSPLTLDPPSLPASLSEITCLGSEVP